MARDMNLDIFSVKCTSLRPISKFIKLIEDSKFKDLE